MKLRCQVSQFKREVKETLFAVLFISLCSCVNKGDNEIALSDFWVKGDTAYVKITNPSSPFQSGTYAIDAKKGTLIRTDLKLKLKREVNIVSEFNGLNLYSVSYKFTDNDTILKEVYGKPKMSLKSTYLVDAAGSMRKEGRTIWYRDGTEDLYLVVPYKHGIVQGIQEQYNADGTLSRRVFIRSGKKVGQIDYPNRLAWGDTSQID